MSVVAIDGPAGAGKTTIAKAVAEALGWDYVDTGAMYRAVTLKALDEGIDPNDGERLGAAADNADISFRDGSVLLDGNDVTARIRSGDVTKTVPLVAAQPAVRGALLQRQRAVADRDNVVMEGRDIGTVVAPDALLKVFLTASLEERARRRLRDVGGDETSEHLMNMREALDNRDSADSGRDASPLKQPPDAVSIDTTGKAVPEIVSEIVGLVKERLHAG